MKVDGKTAKYSDFFSSDDQPTNAESSIPTDEEDGEDEEDEEGEEEEEDDEGISKPGKKRVKYLIYKFHKRLFISNIVLLIRFDIEDESEDDDGDSDDIDEDDDSDEKDKSEVKSSFETRQERLRAKIAEMEEEALQPKTWQMLGETKATLRPDNALLEEDLAFDHTSRQAPVITEETTKTLEDIIRQRIKDQAFDDVVRKIKPVVDLTDYKKQLVLDQEKSKFSLAEIYEQVGCWFHAFVGRSLACSFIVLGCSYHLFSV